MVWWFGLRLTQDSFRFELFNIFCHNFGVKFWNWVIFLIFSSFLKGILCNACLHITFSKEWFTQSKFCQHRISKSIQFILYGKEHFSFCVPQKKDNFMGLEWRNFHCWVNHFNWCPQLIDFFSVSNVKNKSKGYCTLIHSSRNPHFETHTRKIELILLRNLHQLQHYIRFIQN